MAVLFFIFGTVFGSFLTVIGIRLPVNESFICGRSSCPTCKQTLSPVDLVPIISYIQCKGVCKYCHEPISNMYIRMELVAGITWVWAYVHIGIQFELLIALMFISMLHMIVVSDLLYMIIPNIILLSFFPLFLILRGIFPLHSIYEPLLGAIVGFAIVFLIYYFSRGGMGAGDVKLFAVIGTVLGVKNVLLTLLLACILGTIIGGALLYLQVIGRKQPIPFGPFIAVAAFVSYLYGDALLVMYLQFF